MGGEPSWGPAHRHAMGQGSSPEGPAALEDVRSDWRHPVLWLSFLLQAAAVSAVVLLVEGPVSRGTALGVLSFALPVWGSAVSAWLPRRGRGGSHAPGSGKARWFRHLFLLMPWGVVLPVTTLPALYLGWERDPGGLDADVNAVLWATLTTFVGPIAVLLLAAVPLVLLARVHTDHEHLRPQRRRWPLTVASLALGPLVLAIGVCGAWATRDDGSYQVTDTIRMLLGIDPPASVPLAWAARVLVLLLLLCVVPFLAPASRWGRDRPE